MKLQTVGYNPYERWGHDEAKTDHSTILPFPAVNQISATEYIYK